MSLQKIIDYKREELEHRRRRVSLKDVRLKAEDAEPPRDFLGALRDRGVSPIRIIAEVKKASPSAGLIRMDFDPIGIARTYEDNGARALSVLTDERFFQGSLKDLEGIRQSVRIPLLRKDFTFDAHQIYEARGAGADAILLIARILEKEQMKDYLALTAELGMRAVVEVHNGDELQKATDLKAPLIGINNRDLDTFKVDLETSIRLAPLAPKESLLVSESGISTRDDIQRLTDCGIAAFLIGETLLRAQDPGAELKKFLDLELGKG